MRKVFLFSVSFFLLFMNWCKMNRDQKIGIIILIFCIVIWFFVIPAQVAGRRESIFPRFTTIWVLISSVFLIAQSWKNSPKKISPGLLGKETIIRFISIVFIFLIYILIIDFLGFFIPTFLFLVITMSVLEIRDWRPLILIPLILLLAIHFLIEKVLVFPLPTGIFF